MSEKSFGVAGRPEKFGPVHIRFFKKIVGKMGLIEGRNFIIQNGIKINNKVRKLEISVPTLSKYVRRSDELTGEAVLLCSRSRIIDGMTKATPVAEVAVRRGPGRPKNVTPVAEVAVRRGPGRPKKVTPVAEVAVRRGPGRPKNVTPVAPVTEVAVRRGPGRPKKTSTIIKVGTGRGPGRPKKSA